VARCRIPWLLGRESAVSSCRGGGLAISHRRSQPDWQAARFGPVPSRRRGLDGARPGGVLPAGGNDCCRLLRQRCTRRPGASSGPGVCPFRPASADSGRCHRRPSAPSGAGGAELDGGHIRSDCGCCGEVGRGTGLAQPGVRRSPEAGGRAARRGGQARGNLAARRSGMAREIPKAQGVRRGCQADLDRGMIALVGWTRQPLLA
jgi:hypothetical protein